MTINQIIILALIGLISGIFAGTMGVGGGLIIVPALVFFLGMSQHGAQGTSLAILLLPIGILAVLNYARNGYVNYKFAIIIVLTFIIGSYLGSVFSLHMPEKILKKVFGLIMLIVAIRMIVWK